MEKKYYEAYDDRYRQVHGKSLQWFADTPSAIVGEILDRFVISKSAKILEIGCGEGRDGIALMREGYDVLATDVSPAAIMYARKRFPSFRERFQVLDCLKDRLNEKFDFLYAVAVVHMLVPQEDRDGFYSFLWEHLKADGLALIGTMGDGRMERQSDLATAFERQERVHEQSGKKVLIAGTSCRVVSWSHFFEEIKRNGLEVVESGMTAVEPDFPMMMYAVVKREQE